MPANATLLNGAPPTGGDVRARPPDEIVAMIEKSDLRGRGGAGYPLAKKIAAVRDAAKATGRAPLVIANAYDADPDSPLSRTLIKHSPLGVLRGAMIAAVAGGARAATVYLLPTAEAVRMQVED